MPGAGGVTGVTAATGAAIGAGVGGAATGVGGTTLRAGVAYLAKGFSFVSGCSTNWAKGLIAIFYCPRIFLAAPGPKIPSNSSGVPWLDLRALIAAAFGTGYV